MNPAEQALELRPGQPAALSEVFLYWIFANIWSIFALIARRVKRSVMRKENLAMEFDVFISHASVDKSELGRTTVNALQLRMYAKNSPVFWAWNDVFDTKKSGLRKSQLLALYQTAFSLNTFFWQ